MGAEGNVRRGDLGDCGVGIERSANRTREVEKPELTVTRNPNMGRAGGSEAVMLAIWGRVWYD